ncbi:MAG: RNA polymerase sigma factor [Pseudomonadota bacterium]|nr:RNA polymerase sigma factor [Pseudomonadota bacterium]
MPEPRKNFVERLFAEHRSALQAFFYRRIKTKHDAADLVQEVYLRILRVKDADAIRNPEGYLYTVASNLVYEHSVLNRRNPAPIDPDQPLAEHELAGPAGFEELFDMGTRVARLREVLAQLPPKCRATIHLKYQHGLSYQEIAEQLGVSPHMVQKYLGTALAHCRRRMARMR